MSKVNQQHDEEIDLFELLKILWEGKWIIFLFCVNWSFVWNWDTITK